MLRQVALISLLLAGSCLLADSNSRENAAAGLFEGPDLKPVRCPDDGEAVADTLQRRFSPDNALQCLDQIQSALMSFNQLTTLAQSAVPAEKLNEISNLDWETQNLGFGNWVGAARGTLYKQHYIIARLQYDLALERLQRGEIGQAEAEKARHEYERAKEAFLEFWNSFCIAD